MRGNLRQRSRRASKPGSAGASSICETRRSLALLKDLRRWPTEARGGRSPATEGVSDERADLGASTLGPTPQPSTVLSRQSLPRGPIPADRPYQDRQPRSQTTVLRAIRQWAVLGSTR